MNDTAPRYWLKNTSLLDKPNGKEVRKVKGPVLIELLADGRVRSMPGTREAFEGYLPDSILTSPQEERGLMLYAERMSELRQDSASQSVIGRVYAGALVSVVPGRSAQALVGFFPFDPHVAYTERSALGVEPRSLQRQKRTGDVRTKLGYAIWLNHAQTATCIETHLDLTTQETFQNVAGIEIAGKTPFADFDSDMQPVWYSVIMACAAHAVVQRGTSLALTSPNRPAGDDPRDEIPAIPAQFARLQLPVQDLLGAAIEHSDSVYWLYMDKSGPACQRWKFAFIGKQERNGTTRLQARLKHAQKKVTSTDWTWDWYPVIYEQSDGHEPARLKLGPLKHDGRDAYKCNCVYNYALMRAEDSELTLMARTLPEHVLAYDAGEAERWFLSSSACQTAVGKIAQQLALDGTQAPRLGFHAYEEFRVFESGEDVDP